MKKYSAQTKSFVLLAVLAVVGVYACLILIQDNLGGKDTQKNGADNPEAKVTIINKSKLDGKTVSGTPEIIQAPAVDTSAWKKYSNSQYGLSFKYNPDWQVKPAVKKGDYSIIEIDPGKKYYNFKVYISKKGYYALEGLPTKEETIAGHSALNVNDSLFGIKNEPYFFTFDIGISMSLLPQFDALVRSVTFE